MKYTTLYFDLDNTLLDFSASEKSAILRLLSLHGIEPRSEYANIYSAINRKVWERFERGEIKRQDIYESRFVEFLAAIGKNADTAKMSEDYFSLLAQGHDVIKGAKEVLEYVKKKGYAVCVTTNGVALTQHKRLRESGLEHFFDFVFISEETGYQKPDKRYFEYVINNTSEKDRKKILVIGDSITSDITGGINAGIDTCWYNPEGKKSEVTPTFEIRNISKLTGIL